MRRRKRDYPTITWSESKKAWRCCIRVNGRRRDVYGKTEDDVMDKIDDIEETEEQGGTIDRALTVWLYAKRWFPIKTEGLKQKSKDVYQNALDNHIIPYIGNLLLREVRPMNIDELLFKLNGRSASLRSKVLFTLSQLFESALENGIIDKNPCRR